jgi:aminoglycoside phosphotransferase (APT) family kinase protein
MSDNNMQPSVTSMENPGPNEACGDETASIASSDMSTTSTEMFEHEPFATFQSKVVELCRKEWPYLRKDDLTITHMEGGSYNRVIGIQIEGSCEQVSWLKRQVQLFLRTLCPGIIRKTDVRHYVLRIPRQEHAWVGHGVAILKFLAATSVPAPRNRTFSLSAENPIGSPYMIQPRLPGKSVHEVYLELNTQQRISFARDLGSALKEMSKIRSQYSGTLNPDSILAGSSDTQLLRLQCPPRNAFRPSNEPFVPSTAETVFEFFMSRFARQREYDLTLHREYINPWKPFGAIVQHLHSLGFLTENIYTLTHMDFEPRNILIHTTSPTTASLSAIIDWDEAVFAPVFTNCRPPSWLWDFGGDDDGELDEAAANNTPKDADLATVKKTFEDAAGGEYCRWAYTIEYRLARDIARLAITGIHSNMEYEVAERVVKEWNKVCAQGQFQVCGIYVEDDEDDE